MEKFQDFKEFCLEHKYVFVGGVFFVLAFVGIIVYYMYFNNRQEESILLDNVVYEESVELLDENNESCKVTVDVKGEVKNPNIYELDCDGRVIDAINLAGGVTIKADTSILNLSKMLIDEMVIIVYSKEQVNNFIATQEIEEKKQEFCQNQIEDDACVKEENLVYNGESDNEKVSDTPVNNLVSINTGSKEELMTLSGIGDSKAENIILYRKENGNFKSIEEIKNVKGIGDSIFEKIKDNITV